MYILLFFSLVTILLTYLESKGRVKNGMAVGFVIMTILAAIRFDYGNDYMNYLQAYEMIISQNFTFNLNELTGVYREPGWTLLNFMFKPFGSAGFFLLVASVAVFQNCTYYSFIKKYVPINYRWFAVYIYLFNTSLYVLNMSMLRQGLAIALFLIAAHYIVEKKWFKSLVLLLLCSSFHSSALILLPFSFWGFINYNKAGSKIIPLVFIVSFIVFVFNREILDGLLFFITDVSELQEYADTYIKEDSENSFRLGLAFAINSIPFIASLIYLSQKNRDVRYKCLVSLACVAFIISPFGQVAQMITRIAYYFQAIAVATIPIVYYWFNSQIRNALILIYIMIMTYSYYMFFQSPTWFDHYYVYKTVFSM